MPPPLLVDLASIDLTKVVLNREQVYEHLPQRFEFMLLDGVCFVGRGPTRLIAYRDVRADDWWFRGHVPGRPLLPGVLMLEMAAQASALAVKVGHAHEGFIGFGGIDRCKFREAVEPPARLYLLVLSREQRSRRIISDTQGVVNGRIVFEAEITGMSMPD